MPQTHSDNQPLLEDFKTGFTAIVHLKMDISAHENQLSSLITKLDCGWLPYLNLSKQINDLTLQKRYQFLDEFIFKKSSGLIKTDQQYKNIEDLQLLANQLDSMYQELELLEKKIEELEQKLMASGVTQEQLLRYLESEQLIARKSDDKNQSKN